MEANSDDKIQSGFLTSEWRAFVLLVLLASREVAIDTTNTGLGNGRTWAFPPENNEVC
jgi:hypothetical protein